MHPALVWLRVRNTSVAAIVVAGVATPFVGWWSMVALAVVSGIAAVVLADPRIRTVLFVASAAYLFYLALRIAMAGSRIAFIEAKSPPGVGNGCENRCRVGPIERGVLHVECEPIESHACQHPGQHARADG